MVRLGYNHYSCRLGSHICGFYEEESERDEIIFNILGEGTKHRDRQVYVHLEPNDKVVEEKISEAYPDCMNKVKYPNSLLLKNAKDVYFTEGRFSLDASKNIWQEIETEMDRDQIFRALGEMPSSVESMGDIGELMKYESWVNVFIKERPWLCVCLYNLHKFSGSSIVRVLQTHPMVINKGVMTENPFYVDPETWLAQNSEVKMENFRESSQNS